MAKVRFELTVPGAKNVCLAGCFNGWQGQRMKRMKKGEDTFVSVVDLEPGSYQYKFVVDDQWRCAPDAPRACDESGIENSVMEVRC